MRATRRLLRPGRRAFLSFYSFYHLPCGWSSSLHAISPRDFLARFPIYSGRRNTFKVCVLLHCSRMARQRLGQHFLADLDWREQIARAIRVSRQSMRSIVASDKPYCWIEIGAGHGEMTEHLAATGAPVYAIELDASLARRLQHLTQQFPNLTVVPGDILQTDIAEIAAGRRVRIYGNLPYYITSPILHRLFTFADSIDEMHIVIQAEVAERLTARPNSKPYGYLSVATQLYARPELVLSHTSRSLQPAAGSGLGAGHAAISRASAQNSARRTKRSSLIS